MSLLANRFELGPRIGSGALSTVHDAIDRETGRRVAIKLAVASGEESANVVRRFEREAAALAVIQSAHVVELISAGTEDDGRPFLVLERLSGRNLAEVLGERGAMKPARVVRFMQQAAAALELAHGVGIVHRDFKPANVFLHVDDDAQQGVIKVLDFGLVVDTAGPTERTRDAFGGTPLYMAPEQVRGQLSRIGPATDIWAFAFVTLTLLVGEPYWTSTAAADVMREIEQSAIEKPSLRWPWLPPAFDAWFLRSTQRVPERRYRDVGAQAAALAAALADAKPPDLKKVTSALIAASTMAARTPTPSIIRLAGRAMPVVGRQIAYREVEGMLAPGLVVTLTGTAGVGKTRLAQVVCESSAERFVDGAWFVALTASTADPRTAIASAIAPVLGIAPDGMRGVFEHVAAELAMRRALVVLDGAEHVLGGAEAIEDLRASCPAISWLVTSRVGLGLHAHERIHPVEPLELPPERADVTLASTSASRSQSNPQRSRATTATPIGPDEAETFSAVELFVRSAREASPMFVLSDDNVADVIAICRAVDGFPLGIELAAAQLPSATPAQIREALERESSSGRELALRNVARRAVTWSYGLLAPDQQRLLRQLSVMPAGLTFEQVKRELGALSPDPMYAVLRIVQTHLAAWSSDPPRRLLMLDSVRELCHEHAEVLGELPALWAVATAHAHAIAAAQSTLPTDAWLALVDTEHDNLRTVLDHALSADVPAATALAGRLAYYWYLRGHYDEGARWLEAAIERSIDAADRTEDLVRALRGAGRLAMLTCRYDRAEELLEHARVRAPASDLRGEAETLQLLGSIARERGDYERARACHAASLERWAVLADAREEARSRNYLLFAAWLGDPAGDPGDDQRAWWQALDEPALRALGDPELLVWALLDRGAILHYQRDPAAREVLGRAFAEAIAARFHEGIAWSLDLLGRVSLARGELLQARAQLAASLRVHRRLGDRWRCASVLEALAAVAIASERPARAATYLGAADAIRAQIGAPVPACERARAAATEQAGREQLGAAFATNRERGYRTPLDQIVELAREG